MAATGYTGGDPNKLDAAGYTKGDVLAADTSGEMVPVAVGADGRVLTAASGQAAGVTWASGGGGGGGAVDSVNGQTGDVVLDAGDVGADVAGTAAGAVATHSADTTAVHGIADTSTLVLNTRQVATTAPLTGGGDLSANRTLGVSVGTTAGTVAAGDHTHAAAGTYVDDSGLITTGNVNAIDGGWTDYGPALTVDAQAGDLIELDVSAQRTAGGGGVALNPISVGGASPNAWSPDDPNNGFLPRFYLDAGFLPFGAELYEVAAGDLVAGQVTIQPRVKSVGGGVTVRANTAVPGRITLRNLSGLGLAP